MRSARPFRTHPWLVSPLHTRAGVLRLAGMLQNANGLRRDAMRVLGNYSLVYMASVDGYYCDANGVQSELRSGDVVLIFPDLPHAYGPKPGSSWDQIYVVFEGMQFDLWRRCGLISPERPLLHAEPVDYWWRRLEEIFTTEPPHGDAAALRAMGRFLQVFTDLLAADVEASAASPRERWLHESLRLLGEPGSKGWPTPQQVARQVGLSYDNFRKQFSQRMGMAPGSYQRRKRIDRACAAIYQGADAFKELAEELEFCDVFHFSKTFKQVTGASPSEFRHKVRGE